jgi:hypothetical protein
MMANRNFRRLVFFAATAASVIAARPTADIAPPDKRRTTVDIAQRLARPASTPHAPADLPSPFNPPGFTKGPTPAKTADAAAGKAAPAAPESDRDLLATVAAKIPTTGTIILDGKPLLISGTNRIEVGSHFTVVYNGQEYELELTAIDRTTFTVRYKGEEFTRPIKQGRTP